MVEAASHLVYFSQRCKWEISVPDAYVRAIPHLLLAREGDLRGEIACWSKKKERVELRQAQYRSTYPLETHFPLRRFIWGWEGGELSAWEQANTYYLIIDERTLAEFLQESHEPGRQLNHEYIVKVKSVITDKVSPMPLDFAMKKICSGCNEEKDSHEPPG